MPSFAAAFLVSPSYQRHAGVEHLLGGRAQVQVADHLARQLHAGLLQPFLVAAVVGRAHLAQRLDLVGQRQVLEHVVQQLAASPPCAFSVLPPANCRPACRASFISDGMPGMCSIRSLATSAPYFCDAGRVALGDGGTQGDHVHGVGRDAELLGRDGRQLDRCHHGAGVVAGADVHRHRDRVVQRRRQTQVLAEHLDQTAGPLGGERLGVVVDLVDDVLELVDDAGRDAELFADDLERLQDLFLGELRIEGHRHQGGQRAGDAETYQRVLDKLADALGDVGRDRLHRLVGDALRAIGDRAARTLDCTPKTHVSVSCC